MKKILILGGANQHLKFVEAAKELGVSQVQVSRIENKVLQEMKENIN